MNKRLESLRAKKAETIEKMDAIVKTAEEAKRDLSTEEKADFDRLDGEVATIDGDIKREETLQARKADLAKPVDPDPANRPKAPAQARARHGKLRAFHGDGAEDNAYRSGMWVLGALFGAEKAQAFCRENGIAITKVASEGVNSAGGFLVPTEFSSAIIDLRDVYGVFRREARVWPMSSDTVTFPRVAGGLTAYPMNENGTVTESQKSWDQVLLSAKKWGVLTRYSSELSEDAVISIADDLAQEMGRAFAYAEDNAGFNGDGSATYHGIRGVLPSIIDGTHTAGAVDAASNHDTFAEIDAADLATLMAKLPQYALRNAAFYCSQPCFELVFSRLMQAAGGNAKSDQAARSPYQYLGYPVIISQLLKTSTGDLSDVAMLLFGDLRLAATMGSRREMTMMVSNERYFEYDQVGIRGTERFDINVHDLGDNTTAGPLVALIGE